MTFTGLFLLQSLIILWLLIWASFKGIDHLFKNPIWIFLLVTYLIHGLTPYLNYYFENIRYDILYTAEERYHAGLWITIASTLAVGIALLLSTSRKTKTVSIPTHLKHDPGIGLCFLAAIPALLSILYLNISLSQLNFVDYATDRIGFGYGKQLYILTAGTIIVPGVFSFTLMLKASKGYGKLPFILFLCLTAIATVHYVRFSQRNTLALYIVMLVFVWFINAKHTTVKQLVRAGILAMFMGGVFTLAGEYRKSSLLQTGLEINHEVLLDGLNGGFGNHEFITYLDVNKNHWNPFHGKTYVSSLLFFIPRSLWANKPVGAGPVLKNIVMPDSYKVGASGNSSFTTGLYVEAMLNFGVWGVFGSAIILGVMLSMMQRAIRSIRSPHQLSLVAIYCTMLSYQILYSEFLGFIARNSVLVLFALALYFGLKIQSKQSSQI